MFCVEGDRLSTAGALLEDAVSKESQNDLHVALFTDGEVLPHSPEELVFARSDDSVTQH